MCQVDNGTNKTNQKQGKPETDYLNQAWTINRRKFGSVGRRPPVPIDIGLVMVSGVYLFWNYITFQSLLLGKMIMFHMHCY